jgi:rubredoxin
VKNEENEPSEGEKLKRVHLNELVDGNCPQCGKSPVLIFERILIEGSLEYYHLMHTEVEDYYECPACKHSWKKFQHL